LLKWEDKRVTAVVWAGVVALIFTTRYLSASQYLLKALFYAFGFSASIEFLGSHLFNQSLVSQMRPKPYFEIPKDSLVRFAGDFCQFINVFVLEFQRVLFAENVWVTVTAFVACFMSYYAVQWLPLWGFGLLATVPVFGFPLVYITNQEFFDHNIKYAEQVIMEQKNQVSTLASKQLAEAGEKMQVVAGGLSSKAQQLYDDTKRQVTARTGSITNARTASTTSSFPSAPKTEPSTFSSEPVVEEPLL